MALAFTSSRTRAFILALLLSGFTTLSSGLQVTPGSACAAFCLDDANGNASNSSDSTTTASDIVCNNGEYWSTSKGTKFRTCVDCLQNSTAVNGTESDVAAYLYNLRYAVDVCLFSFPSTDADNSSISSPCALSSNCETLQTALLAGGLNSSRETEYQYCSADDSAFGGSNLDSCLQCLQSDTQQTYLSNFLTALSAGCKQKPPSGDLLGLSSSLFTTAAVAITNPSWNQTDPGTATPVTTLNMGTIVGIVLGAFFLFIGAAVFFFLYWRRQKRNKKFQFGNDMPVNGSYRPVQSISSITGSYAPFYTTDYKKPPTDQRNFELYDKIRPQHAMVPAKKANRDGSDTASLWGRDTPYLTRKQLSPGMGSPTPSPRTLSDQSIAQQLDGMPTHPAFIPRAFTRPSRNPNSSVPNDSHPKSNKPDAYVVQQYMDTIRKASAAGVASPPPLPTYNTHRATNSNASNPFSNPSTTFQIPPPPPSAPSAASTPLSSGPRIAPSLVLPSLSRVRSPKMYVPPPLNIGESKPKSKTYRLDSSDTDSEKA